MPPTTINLGSNKQEDESFVKRTSFYVNVEWEAGSPANGIYIRGQMYVESLEPKEKTQKYPLVLIHGDYHSSHIWLTKPDGKPGWASYFVGKGFHVYIVDLPPVGRSNFIKQGHLEYANPKSITASQVEKAITAVKQFSHPRDLRWPTALQHDKWPGEGTRGDPIFDRYCASLTPLYFTAEERQTLAQNALKSLLQVVGKAVGKAVLIGEGSGATAAWLTADVVPDLVSGVAAVEPPGPPFCANSLLKDRKRRFDSFTTFDPERLKYGLANIPLTYDPPVQPEIDLQGKTTGFHPLDLALYVHANTGKYMALQYDADDTPQGCLLVKQLTGFGETCVRKLINLQKMPHVIITAEASSHSAYDVSTFRFLQQAGVTVDWGLLERYDVRGNGHLMFLETNSDDVAAVVGRWIAKRAEEWVVPAPRPAPAVITVPASERSPSCDIVGASTPTDEAARPTVLPLDGATLASHSLPIDLTDEDFPSQNDRINETLHDNTNDEYTLSNISRSVYPDAGMMPPPPHLDLQEGFAQEPDASVHNSRKRKAPASSSHTPEVYNPQALASPASTSTMRPTFGPARSPQNFQQPPWSIQETLGGEPPEAKRHQASHINAFTDYRVENSLPPSRTRNEHQASGTSAQQTNSFYTAPQQPTPLLFNAPHGAYNFNSPFLFPLQGAMPATSFAHTPRTMPNSQGFGGAFPHSTGQAWRSAQAANNWPLSGMPTGVQQPQDKGENEEKKNDGDVKLEGWEW